jgi:methylenetetrahydrofolate dehydrogenase (NADP+)/methenyltetrahydrofolate cyclohydrolase
MPTILDGRLVRAELKKALITKIHNLISPDGVPFQPTLAIVQVGDRPDSAAFIAAKKKFAAEIGVKEIHVKLKATTTQADIIRAVAALDADPSVQGIIVQLPLPLTIDKDAVFAAISPRKDVDGLTAANVQRWLEGRENESRGSEIHPSSQSVIWPATARGIRELLDFYHIPLAGKHVVVVGRSSLVGKPVAAMCLAENATVTVCHSQTTNLALHTRRADILIVAIGKPRFIGASYVREGQVVIDVGISKVDQPEQGKSVMAGDVDFEVVKDIVAAITPVPGGVGQMTVLALFENLVDTNSF